MASSKALREVDAPQGEKMIEIRVRLWTNDIAKGEGKVVPKHAWSSGVVLMQRNETHGITPKNPRPFRSLMQLGTVIEDVLKSHQVMLHPSDRMSNYLYLE
jgi:hypothetical protein